MSDAVLASPELYARLRDLTPRDFVWTGEKHPALWTGMRIVEVSHFPMTGQCKACGGTGEGAHSTYCQNCAGAGQIKTIGKVGDVWIRDKLPRAFEPSFPKGVVSQPPLSRGLT